MNSDDKTELQSASSASEGEVVVKKNDDSTLPEDWMDQLRTVEYRTSQAEVPGTDGISFDTVASRNIESHSEAQMKEMIRQALQSANAGKLQGLQASRTFSERFKVQKKLGGGSYGEVFLVHDSHYNGEFALKIARLEQTHDPVAAADDFLAEARALMTLNHPGVMRVYEANVTDDGTVYMLMQYAAGGNLGTYVKNRGRLTPEQAVPIVLQIARTLIHIHSRGMVHRDLKPDNILFDENDNPLIGDFGLALTDKQFAKGPRFCGTMLYMSPEQLNNQADLVDGRSDIYSLGVLFYELLTGKHPYRSSTKEQLKRELATSDLRPIRQLLPTIPEQLAKIVTRAAAKKTDERYQTATDFVEALEAYVTKPAGAASVPPPAEYAATPAVTPPPAPRRLPGILAALLVAALIFGGGYYYMKSGETQPAPTMFAPVIRMYVDGRAMTSEALPLNDATNITKMVIDLKLPGHLRVFLVDAKETTELPIGSQSEVKSRFEIPFAEGKSNFQGTTQMILVVPSENVIGNKKTIQIRDALSSLSGKLDAIRGEGKWQEFSSAMRETTPDNITAHRGYETILQSPVSLTDVPPEIDAVMKEQGLSEFYGWLISSAPTANTLEQ